MTETESFYNEDDKPRKRFKEIHTCVPINGVNSNIDWSGKSHLHATIKAKIRKGIGHKTIIIGVPIFKRGYRRTRPLRILLDSGSDGDIAFLTRSDFLKYEAGKRNYPCTWTTSNGKFHTNDVAKMDLLFPEFSQSKIFSCSADVKIVSVNDEPTYDLIIGIETLGRWQALLDFSERVITLDGLQCPMKSDDELMDKNMLYNTYREATEPTSTKEETARVTKILDAKYEKADLPKVVQENCAHLTSDQKNALLRLLLKHEDMFQGTLGEWKGEYVHFELKPGAKPFRGRPFQVPRIHRDTIKKEIKRLCDLGVLEVIEESEWGSPSFIIPKKQGTVRFLTDFRELNKRILRKPYPLPKISETLQNIEGFQWATAIDLNMGYYHLRLDPATSDICTIVFPWGIYRYKRLPMGVACSPDIFQAKMNGLFADLEWVLAYIDDLLVLTTDSFEDHLEKLDTVLQRLRDAGLQVNAAKSNFAAKEIEYLGYTLSREGISPQKSKVAAILALEPPTNVKQLRRVLGIVQYYRDLWARRTDLLAPLTDLVAECGTTKLDKKRKKDGTPRKAPKPWHWDPIHQEAFNEIKKIIARDVILAYPSYDEDEPFIIYTDASSRQLGAVITQKNRPLAFFSRKLTQAQQKYSVTDQELLSIVETLKEFKGMLLGQRIIVYTDHVNLTRDNIGQSSDRTMRWYLLLQEYNVDIRYVKGVDNTVADALSRLDYTPKLNPHADDEVDENGSWRHNDRHERWNFMMTLWSHYDPSADVEPERPNVAEIPPSSTTYAEMRQVMTHLFSQTEDTEDSVYPVTINEIAEAQRQDDKWKKHLQRPDTRAGFSVVIFDDTPVLVKEDDRRQRLVIPDCLQEKILYWYHHYLQHPGKDRMEETISATMYWHGMRAQIRRMVQTCQRCQKGKIRKRKYGHLPPKEAVTRPWHTVCVDLVGPFELTDSKGTTMEVMLLTIIDPATGWVEIAELPTKIVELYNKKDDTWSKTEILDKSSATISRLFNKHWLSRYPRPRYVTCDNGGEFKLHLRELCKQYSIGRKPTSSRNPQANAIIERMHGVLNSMLRTSGLNALDEVSADCIDDWVANAAWAIRATYHTVLKSTPGAAVFGRDMLFDIPFIADWDEIGRRRQKQVDRDNVRENNRRLPFDYKIGHKCLIVKNINGERLPKADDRNQGPYVITEVYTNGTVRIQKGAISERINIRRLTPYFEAEVAATTDD